MTTITVVPPSDDGLTDPSAGWIDVPICEAILENDIRILCSVDGSDTAMTALHYLTEIVTQCDKRTFIEVLHIFSQEGDDSLPAAWRKEQVRAVVDGMLTGSLPQKRYAMSWRPQDGHSFGDRICEVVDDTRADYCVMGFTGRKGRTDKHVLASSVMEVLRRGNCIAVVIKDDSYNLLPKGRPAVFVVPVSLNKASTRAFLDAVRFSKPGDQIQVIHVKNYMERVDSDYTIALRKKYEAFFSGLKDGKVQGFAKYHDRDTKFEFVEKKRRETTPQSVVRYADAVDADFIAVGSTDLRGPKGGTTTGSVTLQIVMEFERNFICSNWVDAIPRVYEDSVRPASRSQMRPFGLDSTTTIRNTG